MSEYTKEEKLKIDIGRRKRHLLEIKESIEELKCDFEVVNSRKSKELIRGEILSLERRRGNTENALFQLVKDKVNWERIIDEI